jgi:heterodisulfide reductase subunit A-like polyferredoxin
VEQDKEARAVIFYIDLRVTGRNEDFLRKVEEHPQVELIKGKVAEVITDSNSGLPLLKAEDIMGGRIIEEAFDLVVLATGISPESPGPSLEDFQYRNQDILNSTEVPGQPVIQSQAADRDQSGIQNQTLNQNLTAIQSQPADQNQAENHSCAATDEIILAGCARKPMDVSSCVKDAGRAALKALQSYHNNGKT